MKSNLIRIGLIGIGGWAVNHVSTLNTLHGAALCRFVAVADPTSANPEIAAGLAATGLDIYDDFTKLIARDDIEAVVIATPIPLHASQTIAALNAGKHVYLEKPPCVTMGQLRAMESARLTAGKVCAIGFQMQAGAVYSNVRSLVDSGTIGRVTHVCAGVRWPRDDTYYNRAAWSGKMYELGEPVFDGPATNAFAHILQAGLSLAGSPMRVRGRLARARPIESYDTCYIEVDTTTEVNARFVLSHASADANPTIIRLRGTEGDIELNWSGQITLRRQSGELSEYALHSHELVAVMLDFLNAVERNTTPATSVADTRPFVQAINGALQSSGGISDFPCDLVGTVNSGTQKQVYTVAGLDQAIDDFAADQNQAPSMLEPGPWVDASEIGEGLAI